MTSVVYFLRAESSGLIKIGWTSDLRRRLANLQASSPEQLTLLTSCLEAMIAADQAARSTNTCEPRV